MNFNLYRSYAYVQSRHGSLTGFEGLENMNSAGEGCKIVSSLAGEQRWMEQAPHVLRLDFGIDDLSSNQYPYQKRQKVVSAQSHVSSGVCVFHLRILRLQINY